jgi:hypothetical protein
MACKQKNDISKVIDLGMFSVIVVGVKKPYVSDILAA